MSKIDASKINLGNSFVLNTNGNVVINKEISDAQIIADSIVSEAKKKAAAIIANAQNEAGQIVNQAISDAENCRDDILSESKRQGFEEGYADGKEQIQNDLTELICNVDKFTKCKFDIKHRIIKSLHNDILSLVIEISEKICKTKISENRTILLNVVENAISQLKDKENVTIIINPIMAEKIYAISDELKTKVHNLENIKIIEDSSVSPDGTIVEAVGSRIDSRVSAQIEQFSQKLFAELNATPEIELARELDDIDGMNDKDDKS